MNKQNTTQIKTDNEAVTVISNSIKIAVENYLKTVRFDVTKQGTVKEITAENLYKVTIQGADFSVPCCTEQVFAAGDTVLVLFPQNNRSVGYIIGKGR
jgi:hypothetical protein